MAKDTHTEHCCIVHGCKYLDKNCTVVNKRQPQSGLCEYCQMEGIDPTKSDPETSIYGIKEQSYYKNISSNIVLYSMGRLKDSQGEVNIVVDLFMFSLACLAFIHSVQATKNIMLSDWVEITKEEYEKLQKEYIGTCNLS